MARAGRQARDLFWRRSVAAEVDDEVGFHLEMRTREYLARGMTPDAARAAALERFGDVDEVRAACRELGDQRERAMRRTEYLAELRQDARHALRQLRRTPTFTAVAVLTLALGIGAGVAIFSVVNAVLLRPMPFVDPERVMVLYETWRGDSGDVSAGNFADWKAQSTAFERMTAVQFSSFNLADADAPERVTGARVSRDFFAVFPAPPLLGRTFLPEEDAPGREMVAVLSHRLWARRFASDPGVVGRSIRLNSARYTVVGVMPAAFDLTDDSEELWVPIAFTPERLATHDEHTYTVLGLLKPGVSPERAEQELRAIARRLEERYPRDNKERSAVVSPLRDDLVGDYRVRLLTLLGAVGFVLLIACGNVSNLLLARGAARTREIAVRAALGAGRGRIVRQLLAESLVLAAAATALGLAFAHAGVRALVAAGPPEVPRLEQAAIDGPVLAFALLLALVTSVVVGIVPALRAARPDLQVSLKTGGRGAGTAATRDRVRSALVVGEVALALTLLVGAGLLVRSAILLQRVQPGFDPAGVLTARLALPRAQYAEPAAARRAFQQIADALAVAPGVRAAAVVSSPPLGGGGGNGLVPEGRPLDPSSAIEARFRLVTPGYFEALRIPLRRGRLFTARDGAAAPRVMLVSEALAQRAWPGQDPIGKRIACCEGGPDGAPVWKEVVGVVGDVRSDGLAEAAAPEFYLPLGQEPATAWNWIQRSMTLVARGSSDAGALTPALRRAVRAVDPTLPLYDVATMRERVAQSVAEEHFNTLLLTTLGAIGLVLAAVGTYGVITYFVSQRTQEIGVRMALGASQRNVRLLVTRQGLGPVLLGVALGTVGALGVTRVLQGALYSVSPTDPLTFAAVALLLAAVGLLATYIPARRATRVDPVRALQTG